MPRRSAALDRAAAAGTRFGGHPPAGRREHRVRFWEAIARGASSVDAAAEAGVLPSIGVRWFRKGGGMPPLSLAPVSGRYVLRGAGGDRGPARSWLWGAGDRAPVGAGGVDDLQRELQRNLALRTGRPEYRASTAQTHADRRARRPKPAKLAVNPQLRRYVQDRLAGAVQRPDGSVAGPQILWAGRRRGPRKDRRWGQSWSPEQLSCRLRVEFPDDESMRVSHEAIYQSLYVQGRGALRRELTACLRTGRALRVPGNRTSRGNRSFVTDELLISERPAEVDDRAVRGHWEGDLILGTDRSAIGTLVERSSRFTMLLHLPPTEGHDGPTTNSSPGRTGAGAAAVRDAIADTITTLPEQLRRSLTWDQGIEMAQHVRLRLDTGLQIYFCDPRSPWQRGTNENTNGLLRQYFPSGTNLARHSADELAAVAAALNGRPRKTLGWKTPAEVLTEYLSAAVTRLQHPTLMTSRNCAIRGLPGGARTDAHGDRSGSRGSYPPRLPQNRTYAVRIRLFGTAGYDPRRRPVLRPRIIPIAPVAAVRGRRRAGARDAGRPGRSIRAWRSTRCAVPDRRHACGSAPTRTCVLRRSAATRSRA